MLKKLLIDKIQKAFLITKQNGIETAFGGYLCHRHGGVKMNIKRINKSSIVKAVVVIGIVLIPLMYSFFYLNAFWDPYARLNELPVAVVNNDKGTSINNEERNLGNEVCEKLKENDSIKFIFTDYADARAGTEEKGYYAMIVFPEDFSSSIASASEKEKNRAEIIFRQTNVITSYSIHYTKLYELMLV